MMQTANKYRCARSMPLAIYRLLSRLRCVYMQRGLCLRTELKTSKILLAPQIWPRSTTQIHLNSVYRVYVTDKLEIATRLQVSEGRDLHAISVSWKVVERRKHCSSSDAARSGSQTSTVGQASECILTPVPGKLAPKGDKPAGKAIGRW